MSRIQIKIILVALAVLTPSVSWAGYISRSEVKQQNDNFKQWWEDDLEWKFDELPLKGKVPKHRMPYAGYIYPDKAGGCANALYKYDRAFNWGRGSAASYERHDIAIHKDKVEKPGGLFGWRMVTRTDTPDWAGHCNGWVSAAIRHAEPRKSVVRNGVTFTPADIKGLLAELYVYNATISLGGEHEPVVNPATLHVVLGNWIGRGEHPVGMDSSVGKEVWNYPIYGYSSAASKRGDNRVEVRMNVGYVYMLNQEYHIAPKNNRLLALHYMLYLDNEGRVIGGYYLPDSDRIDMLWAPRQLFPSGRPGNEAGNPYVNTEVVLAMWRESASEDLRSKWWNIDPTELDRIVIEESIDAQPPQIEEELADSAGVDVTEEVLAEQADNDEAITYEETADAPIEENELSDAIIVEETIDATHADASADDADEVIDEAFEDATAEMPAEFELDAADIEAEAAAAREAEDNDAPRASRIERLRRRLFRW